jgi:hypothetical protein
MFSSWLLDDPHCPLKTHAKDHKERGGETWKTHILILQNLKILSQTINQLRKTKKQNL